MPKLLVVCGPTGSGKTQFAHAVALKNNGEIINCDSMQIYSEIPILTASPSLDLKMEIPYHLYNFYSINHEFSVAKYISFAEEKIDEVISRNKLPILVGGTGMYVSALLHGYSKIPEISSEIRKHARELCQTIGQENFHKLLQSMDSQTSLKIKPNDSQRNLRAYEVLKQTGKSIFSFQQQEKIIPLTNIDYQIIFLNPERSLLYQICNERLITIFNNGAIEEVKNVKDNILLLSKSATKAIGFYELLNYLDNKILLQEAIDIAQTRTRQYAKRQITWFKHQLKEKQIIEYSTIEEFKVAKERFVIS